MAFRSLGPLAIATLVFVNFTVSANAQGQSGSIAGVVRDTSGAVLPGVTVEAASPALIEKVRTVVTDGQGRYQDRRPAARHLHRDASRWPASAR